MRRACGLWAYGSDPIKHEELQGFSCRFTRQPQKCREFQMADPEVAREKTGVVNLSLKLRLSGETRGREVKFSIRRYFINKLY